MIDKRGWLNVVKIVASILIGLVALTQLWDWATALSSEVTAEITFGKFVMPPSLVDELEAVHDDLSDFAKLKADLDMSRALKVIEDEKVRTGVGNLIYLKFSDFLAKRLPRGVPSDYRSIDGYWSAVIRNRGTKAIEAVTITLPNTSYISVKREGLKAHHERSTSLIQLGQLQPHEGITLLAWSDIEPKRLYFDDIKLTHSTGVGNISIRAPAGPFWASMERWWPINALFALAAIAFSVSIGALIKETMAQKSDDDRRDPEERSGTSSDEGTRDNE